MLLVFLSGRGVYKLPNHNINIQGPCLGIVLPDVPRGILMADEEMPYDHISCRFAGALAHEIAQRIMDLHAPQPFFIPGNWPEIQDAAIRLAGIFVPPGASTPLPERMRPVDALLAHVLTLLEVPEAVYDQKSLTVENIFRYIQKHISDPADLGQMAAHFQMSREHLCRRVRLLTGSPPMKLFIQQKILFASELLQTRVLSLKEIAPRVGFNDERYFTRVYRASQQPQA